ncbi:MAG: HD domain-containing protein [Limnochordia bacterium]|nr:HD domain-containing protein [Limnochordia bacterium]
MSAIFEEIPVAQLLFAVTGAFDLADKRFRMHAKRVLFTSMQLGEELDLDFSAMKTLFMAAILHDIGILDDVERTELIERDVPQDKVIEHSQRGSALLNKIPEFDHLASIIKHHHRPFNTLPSSNEVFLCSIIFLADRVVIAAGEELVEPSEIKEILAWLRSNSNTLFDPRVVAAFESIATRPSFWLDLMTDYVRDRCFDYSYLIADQFVSPLVLGRLFASMIDLRSPFTSRHSFLVASTARNIGSKLGFSEQECRMLELAGLLHDVGKLAVPNTILEKEGSLTYEERAQIQVHPYFTFRILDRIQGLEIVKEWASFHHERLDGTGYPFQIEEDELSLGSRILAVADVYAALSERRPYKEPLPSSQVVALLRRNAANGGLDPFVVEIVASLPEHTHLLETV